MNGRSQDVSIPEHAVAKRHRKASAKPVAVNGKLLVQTPPRKRHLRLSGSKLRLASICAHGFTPEAEWSTSVTEGGAADEGSCFHEGIDRLISHAALTDDDKTELFSKWHLDALACDRVQARWDRWTEKYEPDFGWRSEVSYAFNVETGHARELGERIIDAKDPTPRAEQYMRAGLDPTCEIPITVDLVYEDAHDPDLVHVVDWKTGRQEHREPIGHHTQLRAGGLCAAQATGRPKARIVASYCEPDSIYEDATVQVEADLVQTEIDLVTLAAATEQAEPNEGLHCTQLYCPALLWCKATKGHVTTALAAMPEPAPVVRAPDRSFALTTKPEDSAHAAWLYPRIKLLEEWVALAKQGLADFARETPFLCGEGTHIYGVTTENHTKIAPTKEAVAVLAEMLGEHVEKAVRVTISKAGIEEATKACVGSGAQRSALERDVLKRLGELEGVVSVVPIEKVKLLKLPDQRGNPVVRWKIGGEDK